MWVLLYRDGGTRRYTTLGPLSEMSKSEAERKRDEVLSAASARNSAVPDSDITFGDFVEGVALPFCRSKWKRSTATTTENRIRHHLISEFREAKLGGLGLKGLQGFLNRKAEALSRSMVKHMRWDLRQIFKVARAEGYVDRDPTLALFTPRSKGVTVKRSMTREEVMLHFAAQAMRERLVDYLAIFVGMRPGEILALQRKHVDESCTEVVISQGLYRGAIDSPKTEASYRTVAIPPITSTLLKEWMALVGSDPEAWVFASENPAKPLWRDNLWYRHMKPKLDQIGLGWANFQVMRRTHASLGHEAGIDPKVAADQRGHGIGVALDVYTKASIGRRAEAGAKLENAVFTP